METTPDLIDNYQINVVTSFKEMDAVRPLWESAQWHPAADYEFFTLITQTRDNVISPCIFTVLRGKKPVALLAGRIEAGKAPIRFGYATVAQIPVRQLILVAGGYMGERTQANWQRLLGCIQDQLPKIHADLAIFERLKGESFEYETILKTFNRSQLWAAQNASNHWFLTLPSTWDEFLKGRSSKHRTWLKRLPRVLDRDFNCQWKIQLYSSPDEGRMFVDAAEAIASRTYQRGLGVGFCKNEETLRRIQLDAQRGRLRAYVLHIRNDPKAFWYCFCYKQTLYTAATGYDPAYRCYELGTILLMKVLEDSCGTYLACVDFGEGDADYKRRFGSGSFDERSIRFFANSGRGFLLRNLFSIMDLGKRFALMLLDRFGVTQRVKTAWRRRLTD
jgi:hypothetical protein